MRRSNASRTEAFPVETRVRRRYEAKLFRPSLIWAMQFRYVVSSHDAAEPSCRPIGAAAAGLILTRQCRSRPSPLYRRRLAGSMMAETRGLAMRECYFGP